MRMPAVADKTLVQVDMAVDETRQQQLPAQVDALHTFNGAQISAEASDTAIGDGQRQRTAVGSDGIDEYTIKHFTTSWWRPHTL
ncbi:hypothetical protein D3C76_802130 [compost metagenome]